jgi:dihydrolipoamide dehydrogenase
MTLPGFAFDGEHVLDVVGALSLTAIPDRLVVGAGYIAMELSAVFLKLGTDVVVVGMVDRLPAAYQANLTEPVVKRIRELGGDIHLGRCANRWEGKGDSIRVATEDEASKTEHIPADRLLVAIGREPVTDIVGLDVLGLSTDEDGFIPTDRRTSTEMDHVHAIGDLAGEPLLAQKASTECEVAAENIAGQERIVNYPTILEVVFTVTEIGVDGMTRADAEGAGFDMAVGEFNFRATGPAMTMDELDEFVRVVADTDSGVILVAQAVGAHRRGRSGDPCRCTCRRRCDNHLRQSDAPRNPDGSCG